MSQDDDLCCARAIVTMKAYVDAGNDSGDPRYRNIKQGRPVQQREAQALQRAAGVPEGPCGIRELQQFQATLPGYQLKVVKPLYHKTLCLLLQTKVWKKSLQESI